MSSHQKIERWRNIFQSQRESGLTIISFCKHQKLNISTYYSWRKRLADMTQETKPKSQQLVPLFVSGIEKKQTSPLTITTPRGYSLVFDETMNIAKLHQILGLIE